MENLSGIILQDITEPCLMLPKWEAWFFVTMGSSGLGMDSYLSQAETNHRLDNIKYGKNEVNSASSTRWFLIST